MIGRSSRGRSPTRRSGRAAGAEAARGAPGAVGPRDGVSAPRGGRAARWAESRRRDLQCPRARASPRSSRTRRRRRARSRRPLGATADRDGSLRGVRLSGYAASAATGFDGFPIEAGDLGRHRGVGQPARARGRWHGLNQRRAALLRVPCCATALAGSGAVTRRVDRQQRSRVDVTVRIRGDADAEMGHGALGGEGVLALAHVADDRGLPRPRRRVRRRSRPSWSSVIAYPSPVRIVSARPPPGTGPAKGDGSSRPARETVAPTASPMSMPRCCPAA